MNASRAIIVCTFICLAFPWSAAAYAGEDQGGCEATLPPAGVIADRSGTISSMERLPQACLKTMVIECTRTAAESILDFDSAAICSTGYEALLRKGFEGNFRAMLAWWQSELASGRVR